MNNTAHGAHVVETRSGHAEPVRPVRQAQVDETMIEPTRPVDGWGFANRVMIAATLVVLIGEIVRHFIGPVGGSVALGTDGRGWVLSAESFMFGLIGGALAAAFGYGIVLLMGGAARSAARYVIGGVIGGFIGAALLLFVFSNTAVETIGLHAFWMLPLGGLLGGLWAGLTSARR